MSKHLIPHIEKSESAYEGFFSLRIDHLSLPNGPKLPYTVLMTKCDAAVILAEDSNGKVVVLKEYRHPTKEWLWGCPGGRLDAGEDPLLGAKRELLEETGYSAEEFISMGTIYPFPAVCDQKIHFILAANAKLTHPTRHETFELIETHLMTKDELHHQIKSGAPVDGILCTALLLRSLFQSAK